MSRKQWVRRLKCVTMEMDSNRVSRISGIGRHRIRRKRIRLIFRWLSREMDCGRVRRILRYSQASSQRKNVKRQNLNHQSPKTLLKRRPKLASYATLFRLALATTTPPGTTTLWWLGRTTPKPPLLTTRASLRTCLGATRGRKSPVYRLTAAWFKCQLATLS